MTRANIGEFIQKRRISLQLKQEDVAEITNITTKTLYLIEKGRGNPSLDTLERITSVLGLEISLQIKNVE